MLNIPDEIKRLFLDDSILKNIRISFPNGEHRDITAYDLEEESFSFTESLCSQGRLKFGLSEAAVVQFMTKGVGNIKDMEIQCQVEIDISSLDDEFISEYGHTSDDMPFPFYPVTLGFFTVKSCPKESVADTESRNVKAYDRLVSQSLDYDKTDQLNNFFKSNPVCVPQTVYTLERMMLQDFNINHERTMVPVEESEKAGVITAETYNPTITSANGQKTTGSEVCIHYFTFGNLDNAEIYDVFFTNLAKFTWVHDNLKFYQEEHDFKVGSNDYWWLDHGLQIEIEDCNGNTLVFTEKDAVNDIISILGYGNIAELHFKYVYSYNVGFYDEFGEWQQWEAHIHSADEELLSSYITIKKLELYDIEKKAIPPVLTFCTLRNVLNAVYEINGTFANISRQSGMLEERGIGGFGLFPSETLYPSVGLYPQSASSILPIGRYSHARHDDNDVKPYGKIIAHYKATDEKGYTVDAVYEYVFRDGITYNLNSNWILQNCIFTEEEIIALCEYMAEKIKHVRYVPCAVTAKGLPWLEAGDTIDVLTTKGGFESIVLRRTLSGIQGLSDSIEARGNE